MNHRVLSRYRLELLIGVVLSLVLILAWLSHAPSRYGLQIRPSMIFPLVSGYRRKIKPRYWTVNNLGPLEGIATFKRPKQLKKIVGLVFYGRPATVSILDCYLRRNLRKNGGMLDEVVFIMRTKSTADEEWLKTLMEQEPAYSQWTVDYSSYGDYRSAYDKVENGTMYIKMDDDIVFIEDTTIPSIVQMKWNHPEYYLISANVMNQPALSWVHWHLGAILPYLPEQDAPPPTHAISENIGVNWRASALPDWRGNDDWSLPLNYTTAHSKHRWLPVRPESSNCTIDDTPISSGADYNPFTGGLMRWPIAAQEHYSFFENLERGQLWRYKFHMWDYNYTRMGIQFIAMLGEDINLAKPLDNNDDEYFFSQVMTQKTRRHGIVDGRGIVAHYSFQPQRGGIATTDILERYRSFAQEHICIR